MSVQSSVQQPLTSSRWNGQLCDTLAEEGSANLASEKEKGRRGEEEVHRRIEPLLVTYFAVWLIWVR
jgi:hypothetical protein